ncbi:hypothetical protein ACGFYQ_39690 [Streptomyces sp. NPDC048258]|uniref:hypothetical protein n=1 Tax=Streptomyces sp. NPDC048258 TaxID=3365527 RepID=UPI00370F8295
MLADLEMDLAAPDRPERIGKLHLLDLDLAVRIAGTELLGGPAADPRFPGHHTAREPKLIKRRA